MKPKFKNIILVLLALGAMAVLITEIRFHLDQKKNTKDEKTVTEAEIDMSLYYSFADVKKDISYLANNTDQQESLGRLVDVLNQSAPVDVAYIKGVCSTIGVEDTVYTEILDGLADDAYVTKEQFDDIYANIQASGNVEGLSRAEVYVFDIRTAKDESGSDYEYIYDGFEDMRLDIAVDDDYLDKIIDVYVKNGSIYRINGLGDTEIIFDNVWILENDGDSCEFLYKDNAKTCINNSDNRTGTDYVATVIVDNDGIKKIEPKASVIDVKVEEIEGDKLTTNKGTFAMSDNFIIYNAYGATVFCETNVPMLLGYSHLEIINDDDKALAAVVKEPLLSDDISVIISNDDYSSYNMEKVIITCDAPYNVENPDGSIAFYQAGDEITIRYSDYEAGSRLKVTASEEGNLQLLSIERNYGKPVYEGYFEIYTSEEYLNIVNVLPLETYLYSVLSSELPAGLPMEELKAFAIVYRAYAYGKLTDASFEDYHADLDDSTLCQLYNSAETRDECVEAVKDTYGLAPYYYEPDEEEENSDDESEDSDSDSDSDNENDSDAEGELVVPFSYYTSYGVQCTNSDMWGGNAYGYFATVIDDMSLEDIDLTDEKDFEEFLSDSMGYDTIDSDMPYYRWQIEFTAQEMDKAVSSMLEARSEELNGNISVLVDDENYNDYDGEELGDIVSIDVAERNASGAVTALIVEGTEATFKISGQTNIRNIITPVNQEIIRADGSSDTGWTSLPSPFYYISKNGDNYTVYGGGFGYGVGISETGAQELAAAGYDYEFILKHYFRYIELDIIYDYRASLDDTAEESEEADQQAEE